MRKKNYINGKIRFFVCLFVPANLQLQGVTYASCIVERFFLNYFNTGAVYLQKVVNLKLFANFAQKSLKIVLVY